MKSFIDVRDYLDDARSPLSSAETPLERAVKAAREDKARLVGEGVFHVPRDLDMRNLHVDMPYSTFEVDSSAVIILGGNASSPHNPKQSIGVVRWKTGAGAAEDLATAPIVRIIGAKGQHIFIQHASHVEVFADGGDLKDYSCAYSTFTLVAVDRLTLRGKNAGNEYGWINENQFFLNRTNYVTLKGDYQHNHNKFHAGTMEGTGHIDLQVGNHNFFSGLRFERNPTKADALTVDFAEGTYGNAVETSWASTLMYTNGPYPNGVPVTVNDRGAQNTVYHVHENVSDEHCLLELSSASPRLSSYPTVSTSGYRNATDRSDVFEIEQIIDRRYKILSDHTLLYQSPIISVENGDTLVIESDSDAFRPRLYLYDVNKNLITDNAVLESLGVSSFHWMPDGYFSTTVNVSRTYIVVKDTSRIRYASLHLYGGNSVANRVFDHLVVVVRKFKRYTPFLRGHHQLQQSPQRSVIYYGSNIDMLKIAGGIPCYSGDLKSAMVNVSRSEHFVTDVGKGFVKLDTLPAYRANSGASLVYEKDRVTHHLAAVEIKSVTGTKVEIAEPAINIQIGAAVSVIITRNLLISSSGEAPLASMPEP